VDDNPEGPNAVFVSDFFPCWYVRGSKSIGTSLIFFVANASLLLITKSRSKPEQVNGKDFRIEVRTSL